MSKRVLLVDADVIAYEAASSCERATEYEPGYWTWHVGWDEVVAAFDALLGKIVDTLGGEPKLCLTDSEGNFRKRVLPTYKGNRASVKKPLVLKALKQWLIDERGAYFRPGLEGDDCMGILATRANPEGEERVIVSVDKDMGSVPGLWCKWPDPEVREVSEDQADYRHLFQTLTGDATDGYSGCPGIGPKRAEVLLQGAEGTWWEAVVAAFDKAGLSEEEALVQARVARILRASDYDFKRKEPILWTPPTA